MERIPGLSGKEADDDVPSFARGQPPSTGESRTAYAERLMNNEYGRGNWRNDVQREREYSQIFKSYRAYRIPRGRGGRE
jgi:hypothetical protein